MTYDEEYPPTPCDTLNCERCTEPYCRCDCHPWNRPTRSLTAGTDAEVVIEFDDAT